MNDSTSTITTTSNLVNPPVIKRKKKHILVSLAFAALLSTFFILFLIYHTKYQNFSAELVCTSEECIDSANFLLQVMDRKKDPCKDFYAYACGNFVEEHPIFDDRTSQSFFVENHYRLMRMVTKILKEPSTNASESLKMAKDYYTSCMDTALLEKLGLQPLYDLLEKLGLPIYPTEESVEEFNLGRTLGLAFWYFEFNLLITMKFVKGQRRHEESNKTYIIELTTSKQDLIEIENYDFTYDNINKEQIVEFMNTVTTIITEDQKRTNGSLSINATEIKSNIQDIEEFSKKLLNLTDTASNKKEANVTTFAELESILEEISPNASAAIKIIGKDFVNTLFDRVKEFWTYDYDADLISVKSIEKFKNLYKLLEQQKPITILRSIWWRVIMNYAQYTTDEMYRAFQKIYPTLDGYRNRTRERVCASNVADFYPFAIAKEAKTVFGLANHTEKTNKMLSTIKDELEKLVNKTDWLDQATKLSNIEKIRLVKDVIGYSNATLDDSKVDEHYKDLKQNKTEYLGNQMRRREWEAQQKLKTILPSNTTIPESQTLNGPSPIQVNALYLMKENSIYIPAGILQRTFYFRGLESLNYGTIGTILGHELTHGFDSISIYYDKNGKYQKKNWPDAAIDQYKKRSKCLIDQYSKFDSTMEKKLDGNSTLRENIADNSGLRESFNAYQTLKKKQGKELKLPGFENFTHEQLFFLSFATLWCETSKKENEDHFHSPSRARVIGTLQNMKEFAKAYHCPQNSFMNPAEKCIIW